jgi:hypothetical protein
MQEPTGGDGGSATGGSGGTEINTGDGGAGATTSGDAGAGGDSEQDGSPGTGGAPPSCEPTGDSERCDGLDNDCSTVIDDPGTCGEGCRGVADGDHGYMICQVGVASDFDDAREICQSQADGWDLLTIESEDENDFLTAAAGAGNPNLFILWIGATDADDEDEWFWVNGTQFYDHDTHQAVGDAFLAWAPDRPNNEGDEDCGILQITNLSNNGTWNDIDCSRGDVGFICESP